MLLSGPWLSRWPPLLYEAMVSFRLRLLPWAMSASVDSNIQGLGWCPYLLLPFEANWMPGFWTTTWDHECVWGPCCYRDHTYSGGLCCHQGRGDIRIHGALEGMSRSMCLQKMGISDNAHGLKYDMGVIGTIFVEIEGSGCASPTPHYSYNSWHCLSLDTIAGE